MGGTNPYIKSPNTKRASKKFKITFLTDKPIVVEVDPARVPYGETGLPGSLLDIALGNGIELDHACGGVCACSTCHVWVKEGMKSCSTSEEAEQDMLDLAPDVRPNSRLGCQCVPSGEEDLVVQVPSWNRNLVREGHSEGGDKP